MPEDEGVREFDATDPDGVRSREVEVVRSGVLSPFWEWLRMRLRSQLEVDVMTLADPRTATDVNFLRGMIRARNEVLRLPEQFIQEIDAEIALEAQDNPEPDDGGIPQRRMSVVSNREVW